MKRHAPATTYNLTEANDLARWERVHCYQPGELLSAILWREFAEVERVWSLDPAVLEAHRRDLEQHTAAMDAQERAIASHLAALNDPTWLLYRQSAAVVLERLATALATALDHAQLTPLIEAGRKWIERSSRGGQQRAKHVREHCAERDRRMVDLAMVMLRNGKEKRELVSTVAELFVYKRERFSRSTVRRVLKKHKLID